MTLSKIKDKLTIVNGTLKFGQMRTRLKIQKRITIYIWIRVKNSINCGRNSTIHSNMKA